MLVITISLAFLRPSVNIIPNIQDKQEYFFHVLAVPQCLDGLFMELQAILYVLYHPTEPNLEQGEVQPCLV